MLSEKDLTDAFEVYWWEFEECRKQKTYWALLHVIVCMPDICGALRGEKWVKRRYIGWCERWVNDGALRPTDWLEIRNRVLHEGRSTTADQRIEFWQPSPRGPKHGARNGTTLHLNVDVLAREMQEAVKRWIQVVANDPTENDVVGRNLDNLVRIQRAPVVPANPSGIVPMPNLSTASGA